MKLSSGVARIPEMLKLGVKVGLAVDGAASNDGSGLLEEIRTGYLLHRLHESREAPTGYDFLKLATRGSASLLGWPEIGRLEPGSAADFFMVDSRRLEMVGVQKDFKSAPATVGYRQPADYTVAAGRVVVREGRLAGADEREIAERANRVFEKYLV